MTKVNQNCMTSVPLVRALEKSDLVWLRPIAEKYGSWQDVKAIVAQPDDYGLIAAMVIAPYAVGAMFYDDHGVVLEGLCDTYGIKQLIRLGDAMCKMADHAGIDLHNHKWHEKSWYKGILARWGFEESTPDVGHIRYVYKQVAQEELH